MYEAIDMNMNNINFPLEDEEKLCELEQGFMNISLGVFQGTVAAGDGVVFRMQRPRREAVNGDVASFFTRKGYYAYGIQAFVDSSCKFLSISMKMCASTHDSTVYLVSDVSNAIRAGRLASWAHIVLDEAYINTSQELSPCKGRNLDVWKDSFNYHLSSYKTSLITEVIKKLPGMQKSDLHLPKRNKLLYHNMSSAANYAGL